MSLPPTLSPATRLSLWRQPLFSVSWWRLLAFLPPALGTLGRGNSDEAPSLMSRAKMPSTPRAWDEHPLPSPLPGHEAAVPRASSPVGLGD